MTETKLKYSKIFVLHEYGAPTHYDGLVELMNRHGTLVEFREFSFLVQILAGVKHLDAKRIVRGFRNFLFLVNLLLSKNKVIILGIAPFDYRMLFFSKLANKHLIFYHTSWTVWDQSNHPKKGFHKVLGKSILTAWKAFLENSCKGIFAVSTHTRESLKSNFSILCPIEVVYHSVDKEFSNSVIKESHLALKLLFVGRVIEKKGVLEILRLSSAPYFKSIEIGFVGDGELVCDVLEHSKRFSNIKYFGIVPRKEIKDIMGMYDVLLCPSKKGYGAWEELFGMSIIEGMACGLIPIATDHLGPRDIITHGENGYLIRDAQVENDLGFWVKHLLSLGAYELRSLQQKSAERGSDFHKQRIASRWENVLNPILTHE